jgi:hypothetical protein
VAQPPQRINLVLLKNNSAHQTHIPATIMLRRSKPRAVSNAEWRWQGGDNLPGRRSPEQPNNTASSALSVKEAKATSGGSSLLGGISRSRFPNVGMQKVQNVANEC